MRDGEKSCSECLQPQKEEMESPYVCEECEGKEELKQQRLNFERLQHEVQSLFYD